MSHMTLRQDAPLEDFVAALGAAYERYMGRLRLLNRLRRLNAEQGGPEHARQLAHAGRLVDEAYLRWRTLAEPHLSAAQRGHDARRRRA